MSRTPSKLRLYVRHIGDVAPRTIGLIDQLRSAARSDSDAAAFLTHMEEGRRLGPHALLAPVADQLRPGITLDDAADIVYALASHETLRALVDERHWSCHARATLDHRTALPGPPPRMTVESHSDVDGHSGPLHCADAHGHRQCDQNC